tara:strand:+ start:41200 stop:41457 length:258 start_codon:yes stop_codon:yes gene_type:complete
MPIYEFIHPITGEIFEELRSFKDSDKPYVAPDGVKCKRMISKNIDGYKANREPFEVDPGWVKECNPKKIRFNDGHEERYDPTKHC